MYFNVTGIPTNSYHRQNIALFLYDRNNAEQVVIAAVNQGWTDVRVEEVDDDE